MFSLLAKILVFFVYILVAFTHLFFEMEFSQYLHNSEQNPASVLTHHQEKRENLYYDGKGRKRSHNKKIIYLCCTLIFTCLCACCFFEFHSCISFQKKALVEKRKVWLKSFVYFIFFFYNFINNFFSKFFPSLIPLPLYTKCYKQINPSPYHTSTQWVLM